MKFKLLFLILISSTLVSAEELNLINFNSERDIISPGETYQTEIIIQNPVGTLEKTDIRLYNSNNISLPIAPFLGELSQNRHYLYFQIPETYEEGMYELRIEDQNFLINGILQGIAFSKQIVLEKASPSVQVTPGFFNLDSNSSGELTIILESKDVATSVNFQVPDYITHPYITEQFINSFNPRTYELNFDNPSPAKINLIFENKSLSIPIYVGGVLGSNMSNDSQNQVEKEDLITFNVDNGKLVKELFRNQSIEGNLNLGNNKNESIGQLNILLSPNLSGVISLDSFTITGISPSSNFSVFLKINPLKNALPGIYDGVLTLTNERIESSLDVSITVLDLPREQEFTEETIPPYREEKPPINKSEKSEIEEFIPWTIPEDVQQQEELRSVQPFIYLILFLLVVAILIFLLSGKKTVKKKSFSDVIRESQK